MSPPRRRFRSAARERERVKLRRTRIARGIGRSTREQMGIDSLRELDPEERRTYREFVRREQAGGPPDISWNGPLARYLDMIGRRPIMENIDVGMTPR